MRLIVCTLISYALINFNLYADRESRIAERKVKNLERAEEHFGINGDFACLPYYKDMIKTGIGGAAVKAVIGSMALGAGAAAYGSVPILAAGVLPVGLMFGSAITVAALSYKAKSDSFGKLGNIVYYASTRNPEDLKFKKYLNRKVKKVNRILSNCNYDGTRKEQDTKDPNHYYVSYVNNNNFEISEEMFLSLLDDLNRRELLCPLVNNDKAVISPNLTFKFITYMAAKKFGVIDVCLEKIKGSLTVDEGIDEDEEDSD